MTPNLLKLWLYFLPDSTCLRMEGKEILECDLVELITLFCPLRLGFFLHDNQKHVK